MNIDETLSYIHAVCWRSSIPGLERIRALLALMGDPQKGLEFIHVTGTNGKGSTCAMMASILQAAGYRTGLYTSPFLIRFNERMQVDGQQITDDELCEITAQVRPLADSLDPHPTEFEMVTAIAFAYFARHNCDIVVCEVGMGGEFDATNVIPAPEAAVFCNIGLDHTQYLGDTIEKIAATKAGIIKPGCDAVLYRQTASAEEIIRQRCERLGVPLHLADFDGIRLESAGLEGQVFDWEELTGLRLPLLGRHQLCNAAVALTAIRARPVPDHRPGPAVHHRRRPQSPVHPGPGAEHPGLSARAAPDGADRGHAGQGLPLHVPGRGALRQLLHHGDAG